MPLVLPDNEAAELFLKTITTHSQGSGKEIDLLAREVLNAVLRHKDRNTPMQIRQYEGKASRILRVRISGERYVVMYDKNRACIDLRALSTTGDLVARFSTAECVENVHRVLGDLSTTSTAP